MAGEAESEGRLGRRLEGKAVLLTGAASGIGRATALRTATEGARLFCTDVQAEALEDTAKQVRELGGEVVTQVCDVADGKSARDNVDACVRALGGIDALCNIAGILHFSHTHEHELDVWDRVIAVNLTGTFLMCREALPHLLARQGCIVNMGSTAALAGHPWTAAYSASKGGIVALTRTLAVEYAKQGLRANSVCPGDISTPIRKAFQLPEGADSKLVYRIMALDKPRGPETVASVVAFLISDDAAHVNGEEIRVDGATLA